MLGGGGLELAARVNLGNIVRQTHLELAVVLPSTEPFSTKVSVLSVCLYSSDEHYVGSR